MTSTSRIKVIKATLLVISLVGLVWVFFYVRQHNAEIEEFVNRPPASTRLPDSAATQQQAPLSVEKQIENEMVRVRAKLEKQHREGLAPLDALTGKMTPEEARKSKETRRMFNRSIAGQYSRKQIHLLVPAIREMISDPTSPAIATPENADTKPTLSWRVYLLPYIGEKALFDQFRLNEPWDSEHNLPLADRMPSVYRGFFGKPDLVKTRLMTIDAPKAFGRDGRLFPLESVGDKHSETLALIIAGTKHAVPWTSPNDFVVTADTFEESMKWVPKPTYWVGTVEGAALNVRFDGSFQTFQSLMTIDGGEPNALDAMVMEKAKLMKADE